LSILVFTYTQIELTDSDVDRAINRKLQKMIER